MKYKNKKLLFLLSQNCRESLKNIGRELKQSEQTTSYQISKLEKNKHITYYTVVDYIKLGFSNLLVGLNLKIYNTQNRQKILAELKKDENVITIYVGEDGVDFLVEYKARNLSHFNKNYSEFMHNNYEIIQSKFVLPIIVRHHYPRNYLIKNNVQQDIVTLGDRDLKELGTDHEGLIQELVNNPKITLLELSQKSKLGIKKVVKLKKDLEKERVIRKYSCFFNYKDVEIQKQLIFIRLRDETYENISKLTEFAKLQPHIIELTKLIGHYNVVIDVEFLENQPAFSQLREEFPISDYLIVNVTNQI